MRSPVGCSLKKQRCHCGVGDRTQHIPQSASVIRKTAFGIGAVGVGAIENSAPIAVGHARLLCARSGVLPLDFVEVCIFWHRPGEVEGCSHDFQGECYQARRVVCVATPPFQGYAGERLWFVAVLIASAMCFNMTERRLPPGPWPPEVEPRKLKANAPGLESNLPSFPTCF